MNEVTLFPTCLGDMVSPRTVVHSAAALRACGLDVRAPRGATCCGQPAFNGGFPDQARRVARTTLRALARHEGLVVVPSGSCAAMMRLHWPALFRGERDEVTAREVAGRVRELSQVLDEHTGALRAAGLRWDGRVGVHVGCHMLRELRLAEEPRRVVGCVDGAHVVPLASEDRCCGFGGLFSVKYPEVSVAMADDRLADARDHHLDAVVSCDPGCVMQLGGRAARVDPAPPVMHLATFLHRAGLR